jgi:hypothetical protein
MSGWVQCRLTCAEPKSSATRRNQNYQQADGCVAVPEVLRPYMGGIQVLTP